MATLFSFDVVSDYNLADVINAIDQAIRELQNRYDFKGSHAALEWLDGGHSGLKITGDSEYQIDAILDIVRKKLAGRNVSQKILDASREPMTSNLKTTQEVRFKKGLDQDKAKKITGLLRERFPKIKAQIQGDAVRVFSPKKDELQAVMQTLEQHDFDFPLRFTNYR